jgi:hypothetical protein
MIIGLPSYPSEGFNACSDAQIPIKQRSKFLIYSRSDFPETRNKHKKEGKHVVSAHLELTV